MILLHLAVIGGAILTGGVVGAAIGHKVGCYTTWRLVTWRLGRP